jgi:DJ-1/PfpI family protein
VSELAVVFIAFDGVQPIDVVGPHEVFANAGDAAASLGRRAGYRVRVASARGGPVRTESGLELGTEPLPGLGERIDTLVLPGGTGSRAASADPGLIAFVRAAAGRWMVMFLHRPGGQTQFAAPVGCPGPGAPRSGPSRIASSPRPAVTTGSPRWPPRHP